MTMSFLSIQFFIHFMLEVCFTVVQPILEQQARLETDIRCAIYRASIHVELLY